MLRKHGLEDTVAQLNEEWAGAPAEDVIKAALGEDSPLGKICLVSSFGAESAVLLHLVSRIDPELPVILLDTRKLFGETKRYSRLLERELGLRNVRRIGPAGGDLEEKDPTGTLWASNPDLCCHIRKVLPLRRALDEFDSWISGRKSYQSVTRSSVPLFEASGKHIKLNPLISWSEEEVREYFAEHDLPRHPLESQGYLSIGCMPCTDRVVPGENSRAGRWRGQQKDECGIHINSEKEQ